MRGKRFNQDLSCLGCCCLLLPRKIKKENEVTAEKKIGSVKKGKKNEEDNNYLPMKRRQRIRVRDNSTCFILFNKLISSLIISFFKINYGILDKLVFIRYGM